MLKLGKLVFKKLVSRLFCPKDLKSIDFTEKVLLMTTFIKKSMFKFKVDRRVKA